MSDITKSGAINYASSYVASTPTLSAPMIQVGGGTITTEARAAFQEVAAAVLSVINAVCADSIKSQALDLLREAAPSISSPDNVAISSCSFVVNPAPPPGPVPGPFESSSTTPPRDDGPPPNRPPGAAPGLGLSGERILEFE